MMANEIPLIVSFYSFKGGTGRTTAAANVAAILAKKDKKELPEKKSPAIY